MGVAKDRISELPDSILHDQILSRLPTKLVVSTSILSKRWRSMWTGVPTLEFSYPGPPPKDSDEPTKFMNFVDNVLFQHQISNLRLFNLACGAACDVSRIFVDIHPCSYKSP
ncbi:hypothetical protein Sjap_003263 [Stephania japonica]|uniref:F-box domain-containing protein n=1 Tax=Stephania japonica TaxID=461633 RepID=A0AAP0PTD1_9MAGN